MICGENCSANPRFFGSSSGLDFGRIRLHRNRPLYGRTGSIKTSRIISVEGACSTSCRAASLPCDPLLSSMDGLLTGLRLNTIGKIQKFMRISKMPSSKAQRRSEACCSAKSPRLGSPSTGQTKAGFPTRFRRRFSSTFLLSIACVLACSVLNGRWLAGADACGCHNVQSIKD